LIVYLDTSAVVPLLVAEPTSDFCRYLWDQGDAVTTSRLTYVEAAAALAQAERAGRLTPDEHRAARRSLDRLWAEFDVIEVDDTLSRRAAALARDFALRGYDAVHCASAEQLDDDDVVAATGDRKLLDAWRKLGLSTADTILAD
jgi:predicted nucleic acid-binding protein